MQTIFEKHEQTVTKRNYFLAFVTFIMPFVFIFLPQLFEPIRIIKNSLFEESAPDANYYTLDDVGLIFYFGLALLFGIIAICLPNKKIPTIIFATLGILINIFILLGISFEIKMRGLID